MEIFAVGWGGDLAKVWVRWATCVGYRDTESRHRIWFQKDPSLAQGITWEHWKPDPRPLAQYAPPTTHPTASSDDGPQGACCSFPRRDFHVPSADALLPVCISSQNRKKKTCQFLCDF